MFYKVFAHIDDEGIIYNDIETKELIDDWVKEGGDVISDRAGNVFFLMKNGTRYYKIVFVR